MSKIYDPPGSNHDVCEGDERLVEEVCDSRFLFTMGALSLKEDTVVLSDRSLAHRRYFSHPGAVVIAGVMNDQYLFIRQYRCACSQIFWEFPAGKIDPYEEPLEAAKREFVEEGGVKAKKWEFMGCFYPCIGYSSEKMYLYYASELEMVGQDPDDGEFVNCFFLGFDKIREMLTHGSITDAKTLAALTILTTHGLFSFS
ncbi:MULTISPECIES: NUDIX domain-containing protein [Candidatus Ichthyocystis]|uniref:GDP-mannose pyrophosphatase n=1 Tax=Candidatus Ichthyocystis hellenicum TaxID=1561003 RepID=A0A0S4M6G5_9BURK|nr:MULTISPECIES: NUDIX hydrolase [Ichthyocystis]CUT17862.1 putative ADP-ribose pyrophosphatase [Candidatus Ichthyocystis hellenicum]